MIVSSGGKNEHGPKLHVYYVLAEPMPPAEMTPIAVRMADMLGSDQIFMRRTQPIRIPGSIHLKGGDPKPVKVERWNDDNWKLDKLGAKLEKATTSPWATAKGASMSHRQPGAMFSPDSSADSNAILTTTIRSGGNDGVTRYDALNQ